MPPRKPATKAAPKRAPAKRAPAKRTPAKRTPAERTPAKRAESAARDAEEARDEAIGAARTSVRAATDVGVDDPLLDTAVRQMEAGVTDDKPYGELGEPMSKRSPFRIAFAAALGVLLALLLAKAVIIVRGVIILIVISAFLAIGLSPAVEWLQRRKVRRSLAVTIVIGAVLLFFGGFFAAAAPPVATQAGELRTEIPTYLTELRQDNATYRRLDEQFNITERIKAQLEEKSDEAAGAAVSVARGVLTAILKTLTVLVLTLYFLSAYPAIKRGGYRLVPRSRRARVGLLGDEILSRVGGYVLGNIATSVVAGVAALIFFYSVGMGEYAIALAMLVAILDLIPLVGATIAAVICTFVAFFVSVPVGLICAAYFLIYQQVENYVIVPKVMKRTVDVSPLASIVAALTGGALLGVVGALLAIPIAAAIQLIGSEVVLPRQDQR